MTGPVEVLLDLLFPPKCVFCRKLLHRGEEGLCASCRSGLPWTLAGEAEQRPEFVSLCVSPLWYQDDVRASFHRYKFQGSRATPRPTAAWWPAASGSTWRGGTTSSPGSPSPRSG